MPKQLNVNLAFTADTTQAKRQLQDLQNQLTKLTTGSLGNKDLTITKQIQEATAAAAQLKVQLEGATNATTGKLDLGRFAESMRESGMSLTKYREQLSELGPEGSKAFLSLAQSISNAEVPLRRSSALLDQFWTTLKNTARWQFSSSALHAFMGAVQGAYGYAQDLNASLNSIRIVSGQSADQMARFAEQANRSAQALSTSTLAYTDAALIFYQQGLSGEAVTQRVDTVLKLSNVTGDSAEQVSSYMTAIWNNFYDGSESLESFADKITALGAATASSSAEIASGLQQFAAVGQTIGLSYDYAATALATIIAQTRQSESTVGNSLRTILSRLSSLKMGETLEDGLDLTKYTKALQAVGVSVLDQNNELKEMDDILDDIGEKWQSLSRAQQITLAQTVGGVRQYTNLVALFDNWDQFQRNLAVTQGAEGTLQEQADIYAESWEAARKRVQAAWQAIYQDLIDDKFFITILNGIEKVLKGVDSLIDSAGGLKGVLSAVGVVLTTAFSSQIAQSINNIAYGLKMMTPEGRASIETEREKAWTEAAEMSMGSLTSEGAAQTTIFQNTATLQKALIENAQSMSAEELKINQLLLDGNKILQDRLLDYAKNIDKAREEADAVEEKAYVNSKRRGGFVLATDKFRGQVADFSNTKNDLTDISNLIGKLSTGKGSFEELEKKINSLDSEKLSILQPGGTRNLLAKVQEGKFSDTLGMIRKTNLELAKEMDDAVGKFAGKIGVERKDAEELYDVFLKLAQAERTYKQGEDQIIENQSFLTERFKSAKGEIQNYATAIVSCAQALSQITMGLTSLNSAFDILEDKDLSWTEKLSSALPSLAMGLSSLAAGMKNLALLKDTKAFSLIIDHFKEIGTAISLVLEEGVSALGLLGGALVDFLLPIAAVIVAVYALKKAWDAYQASTPEGKLKAANEQLEEASKEAEKAKQAYDDLNASLKSYNDLKKKMVDMEESERTDSIAEMNNQILDLILGIENWTDIFTNGINYGKDGLIEITGEQQKELQNALLVEASRKRSLEYATKIAQLEATEEKEDKDYSGPRITTKGSTTISANDPSVVYHSNFGTTDRTSEIADAFAKANLTNLTYFGAFGKNQGGEAEQQQLDKMVDAIKAAGITDDKDISGIIGQIYLILENQEQSKEFLSLIQEHAANIATEETLAQAKAKEDWTSTLGSDYNAFDTESQNKLEQALIDNPDYDLAEAWAEATESGEGFLKILNDLGLSADELKYKIKSISFERPLDEDVDEEEFANLSDFIENNANEIKGLSVELLNAKEASDRVAESILRFDDAIQDVNDHYQEWMDGLNSKAVQDQVKAMDEMRDTYGDLLDLSGDDLSASFLKSTQNLDLMKAAIEGNEEAYEKLREAAMKDLVTHLFVDDTAAQAQLYDINNRLQADMANLEIGAEIHDESLFNEFERIINAAGLTAAQASDLLASMGVDAEIEEVTEKVPERKELIDAVPTVTDDGEIEVPVVAADGTVDYDKVPVQGLVYKAEKHSDFSESEQTITALRVKSARKSSGGGFKFNNSTHGAGSQGAGKTSTGSGGGGGSKGSSPKKKTVKEHKKPEQKTDRYHDIKERIADLNTELKRLEKTESRVYGKAKLKYMDQEIEKLEKQIELTDEYIAEIKKYAKEDQANLRGIGMGATFDENGRLTNYEQVLANIVADYNKAIAAYNSEADIFNASAQEDADSARLEAAEKAVSAAKELYDERLKILDQYEDTYNLLQEKMDERIDQVWELFDQRLERVTFEIEFELDWNEKELTQLDWLLKYIGKDADRAADAIANLSKQFGTYEESIEWAKKGIAGIFGLHDIAFDFDNADPKQLYKELASFMTDNNLEGQLTEKEAEALLSYIETLRDAYDGMHDAWIEAHDHMMTAFDEWNERLEEGIEDIETYGQQLENIQKIVDLTGRKMLHMGTQDLNKMNQAIVQNAQEALRAAKAQKDANDAILNGFEERYQQAIAQGLSAEVLDKMQEEYRTALDKMADVDNNFYSAWVDALNASEDAFTRYLESITQDYNEAFGKMDLNYMADQFQRQKDVRDLYLDDYQKYHELNKTAQELNKSLAATNNELIRGKMLDLQDDMNASMESGVQISAAQAEIYARRVALLQAEAELLDAQNAKSAVRMTRDNEGNFSYTYTADQDQIDSAQNNYGDKFYELLDYERNYMDEVQGQMLEKRQEFIDRLNEITTTYWDDDAARQQAIEDLREEYLAYMDYFVGEQEMDLYEMKRLRDEDWEDFQEITGLKLAEHDDFITFFKDTIYGDLADAFETASEDGLNWKGVMEESIAAAKDAVTTYQRNTEVTFQHAGENVDTYGAKVSQKFDEIANKSSIAADTVEDMGDDMVNTMEQIQSEAWTLDSAWGQVNEDMRTQIANTISALQELLQSLDLVAEKAQAAVQAAAAAVQANNYLTGGGYSGDYGGDTTGSGGGGSGGPGNLEDTTIDPPFDPQAVRYQRTIFNQAGDDIMTVMMSDYEFEEWKKQNQNSSLGLTFYSRVGRRDRYSRFASGGYTGSWGPEGKLAMLHEKELVLNKDDTSNMLTMVNMVRNIVDTVGSNGMLNTLALAAGGATGLGGFGTALDQNVHIEASFPNVQSHTEIELALNNLINSASQYVNRK